ncbi:MAG: DUF86 domain-containing protein [Chloroflexi bacterium]|nr:DUF86 domain-containing protein [Chloroflexota bacterium]
MNPEAKTFAEDIIHHANLIQTILADKTFDDYTNDINTRFAVERLFSIIGEAMNGLAHHAPADVETITAYPRIIAFRNILIHRYSQVDNEIVWDIAHSYLPILITEVTKLLKQP